VHGLAAEDLEKITAANEQRPSTADGAYQCSRARAVGDYGNRSFSREISHARPSSSMRDVERNARNRSEHSSSANDRVVRKTIGNPADILQRFQASPSSSFQMVDAEIKISLTGKTGFYKICNTFYGRRQLNCSTLQAQEVERRHVTYVAAGGQGLLFHRQATQALRFQITSA